MPTVVNVTEAKAQLSRLLERVRRGERVVLGKAGRPIAVLSPYDASDEPREFGGWEGQVWIADDFDEPLPAEVQAAFEGRDT